MTLPQPAPLVSYVVRTLPKLSETFVLRELAALHEQGFPLEIWTLVPADPAEAAKVPEFAAIAPLVRAVPRGPAGLARMVGELLGTIARRPGAGLRAVAWAARWAFHDRDPRQLAALPYAAHLARHARGRHFHAHFANTPATAALLAGMLSAPPRTASFTGHAKDLYTVTSRAFLAEKIRRARFVVAGTSVTQRFLVEVQGGAGDVARPGRGASAAIPSEPTPVVLARHGVEFDGRVDARRSQVDPSLVVAVGRLVEKKGFADLLDAVAAAQAHGTPVHLELIGDGPLETALRARAAQLDIASRVTFLGARSQVEIADRLGRAAVFALPCVVDAAGDADTFPLAIVEAMRQAVPVLTTTVGEMAVVLEDGLTARVVAPRSPDALGAALRELLADPEGREAIGAAGRALAERDYDTARAVQPLVAAFQAATSDRPATS